MKKSFFPHLAWTSILKNRKLYFPFMLSAIGMILMFYILHGLSVSPLLKGMRGGHTMEVVLSLGKYVIAVFAVLFLTYTNSFLIRRRYKEFGLYNILGMDKHSISRILFWEFLIVAAISLAAGIVLGIAFSKFAELGLMNFVRQDVDYTFRFSWPALWTTLEVFGAIFVLLLLKALLQVRISKPLELLKSENHGEKPPKANWLLAAAGAVILGAAYYIAVTIQNPITAMTVFFVAVLMVILATYLLFIAGSVTICRLLQKNRKFYFQKSHFVSVSSMVFRMKRNGAGLASICILSTMVLVILSSTSSLYLGMDDTLKKLHPQENQITLDLTSAGKLNDEAISHVKEGYEKAFADTNTSPEKVVEFPYLMVYALYEDGKLLSDQDVSAANRNQILPIETYFVPQEDYNRIMGTDLKLKPGHAACAAGQMKITGETLTVMQNTLTLDEEAEPLQELNSFAQISLPTSLQIVVTDSDYLSISEGLKAENDYNLLSIHYYYGYDLDAADEVSIDVFRRQLDSIQDSAEYFDGGYGYSSGCYADDRDHFYSTYGGLFFIGIMLSIVFSFAAAMIIYYKQISEGYEDQSRFEIMQKIGMTKADIKKSINSQVLTVFFAPLLFAGLHLGFAFPLVWKILQCFNLTNLRLCIWTNIGAFIVFGLIYAAIYKITARSYYKIVSEPEHS